MRIDVWSDVICPWCWLGKARLEAAVKTFAHRDEVEILFHSFELDPRTPNDLDIPVDVMLKKKYGLGAAQLEAMHERMRGMGAEAGLDFRFDNVRTSNTFEAHQLIHLAHAQGKQKEMAERLFRAQFSEGVRVGERKELIRLATEIGLDAPEVESALETERFGPAVRRDEEQARELGISGVPFYVIDGAVGVSGAQSVEVFRRMLDDMWAKRATSVREGAACDTDNAACDVP